MPGYKPVESMLDKPQPVADKPEKVKLCKKEKKRLRRLLENLFYEGEVTIGAKHEDKGGYIVFPVEVVLDQLMIDDLCLPLPVGTKVQCDIHAVELGKVSIVV